MGYCNIAAQCIVVQVLLPLYMTENPTIVPITVLVIILMHSCFSLKAVCFDSIYIFNKTSTCMEKPFHDN
jgi:hypothetical protein